jgi:hypothetical protein
MARWNRRWMIGAKKADSKWEKKLAEGCLKGVPFHSDKLDYVVHHTYEPDFIVEDSHRVIYIEAKGRFRESSEASKYKWVRESFFRQDKLQELVFLFMDPFKPMPHAKKRKDGTKQSHAEWAERNGFRYFTEETIHEIL